MLPLEDGGVVDAALRASSALVDYVAIITFVQVYRTSNLRIVDLSIVPLHVGGHTQSAVLLSFWTNILFSSF